MAGAKQAQENSAKLKETVRQTHNRLLRWREIGKEKSLVDKRRTNSRITRG
jgi:hypothetical protein